jgi:hypothetical protein
VFGVGIVVPFLLEHGNDFAHANQLAVVSLSVFVRERIGWFLEIRWELDGWE